MSDYPGFNNFSQTCKKHDACYDKCGSDKSKCDAKFFVNMMSVCKGKKGIFAVACFGYALEYYNAVKKYGKGPYVKAQKKCHKCKK